MVTASPCSLSYGLSDSFPSGKELYGILFFCLIFSGKGQCGAVAFGGMPFFLSPLFMEWQDPSRLEDVSERLLS